MHIDRLLISARSLHCMVLARLCCCCTLHIVSCCSAAGGLEPATRTAALPAITARLASRVCPCAKPSVGHMCPLRVKMLATPNPASPPLLRLCSTSTLVVRWAICCSPCPASPPAQIDQPSSSARPRPRPPSAATRVHLILELARTRIKWWLDRNAVLVRRSVAPAGTARLRG